MLDPAPTRSRLVSAVVALWGAEALLARVSSDRQPLDDLLVSAVGLGLLGLPAVLAARALPRGRLTRVVVAGLAAMAPALIVAGILAPNLRGGSPLVRTAAVGVGAALLLAGLGAVRAPLGPVGATALVGVAALASWLAAGALPPASWLLALVVGLVALGVLCSRPRLSPLAVPLVLVIATRPLPAPSPAWAALPPAAPDAPDILLVTIDTLRADTGRSMAAYQRLAARGRAFPDTQAAAPWTLPSFGTLHTGLPIGDHGAGTTMDGGHGGLRAEVRTLAERLAAAGYDTAAVVGRNPWLAPAYGYDRGFALYDHSAALSVHALPRGPSQGSTARPVITRVLMQLGLGGRRELRSADELVDRAVQVVDRRRPDRPLFLWIHFLDCHIPYRHATDFDLPWRAAVDLDGGSWTLDRIDGLAEDPYWPTPEGRAVFTSAYAQEVGIIDDELARLLDRVEAGPRASVVALTSDHGEEFFEHGAHGHGHAFWQEVIAVPLVIAGLPGVDPGSEEPGLVHHLDLAPTLLAAAGLPDDALPGRDLARPLDDSAEGAPVLATENLIDARYGLGGRALRRGDWKVVVPADGAPMLFDLAGDPAELSDRAALRPEVVDALLAGAPAAAALQGAGQPVDPATEDMLRTLGYVSD